MNSIPVMKQCLQTVERNHAHNMRYTWYVGTRTSVLTVEAIEAMRDIIAKMEQAEAEARAQRIQHVASLSR